MAKVIRGKNSDTVIIAYEPGEKEIKWKPKFKLFKPKRRSQATNKRVKKPIIKRKR
jgi:hypothetical protein